MWCRARQRPYVCARVMRLGASVTTITTMFIRWRCSDNDLLKCVLCSHSSDVKKITMKTSRPRAARRGAETDLFSTCLGGFLGTYERTVRGRGGRGEPADRLKLSFVYVNIDLNIQRELLLALITRHWVVLKNAVNMLLYFCSRRTVRGSEMEYVLVAISPPAFRRLSVAGTRTSRRSDSDRRTCSFVSGTRYNSHDKHVDPPSPRGTASIPRNIWRLRRAMKYFKFLATSIPEYWLND